MYLTILWLLSAAPGVLFLLLIVRMDREEPEPLSLVLRVIALGAASAVVALILERVLDLVPLFHAHGLVGAAASSFIQVAPVEELCKLGVVLLFVWRNPNFNEENDGIVYVGASAVGFAVLENILYVFENGIGTGIVRAFTAVPLHVFTAVIMGLSVGRARFAPNAIGRGALIARGFSIAWLIHGLYDTLATTQSAAALLILPVIAGTAAFGIVALKRGHRLSMRRWRENRPSGTVLQEPRPPKNPARWMPIVSRILILASAAVWALLLIGALSAGEDEEWAFTILGGGMITILPLTIGIVMEVLYHGMKRRAVPPSA